MGKIYRLAFEDFKRAFEFGTKYFLDPQKSKSGRTTFEPRGLGAVLDAFSRGKLAEVGTEKILKEQNPDKDYVLDFDIKSDKEVKNEPDIIKIIETKENIEREPNLFIEIKTTSEKDRWIGITEEQFNTIKRNSNNRPIYFIYVTINSKPISNNIKTSDLTGIFLKEIEDTKKSKIFQQFAQLNAECSIEFILSADDLYKYGYKFDRGMILYDTNIFKERNKNTIYKKNGKLRKDVSIINNYTNSNDFDYTVELNIKYKENLKDKNFYTFHFKGKSIIFEKRTTAGNTNLYIECISNVIAKNEIFGEYKLEKGKIYNCNIQTLGRDPFLKRNNIFISKNKVYNLIRDKKIQKPEVLIKKIANEI